MRRLLRLMATLCVLAALAAAAWTALDYQRFVATPLAVGASPRELELVRGDSLATVVSRLRAQGLTRAHALYWRVLGWHTDTARRLQVGQYLVSPGTTPAELLRQLHEGRVQQYRFTLVEGWNIRELRGELARRADLVQTIAALDDATVMDRLGRSGVHPEGRFLPETYAFVRGETDLDVLRRAASAMDTALARAWAARAPSLPLEDAEEALVLASIVEKETGLAAERPRIAGVFVRRLQMGMLLQTDPTVIYGIGDQYAGNITRTHLRTDTPYNTYTRAGLPPTPIAMPGLAAIEAVLHPAPGDALYFVARGDGSHAFSRTLAEHNTAVARFQLGRR